MSSNTLILDMLPQFQNALAPIEVTEFGIVMLVKLLHPEKAEEPIEITDTGMVMLSRLV